MRQAILITAYKDISQLKRLIDRMQDFWLYVHIDKKARGLYEELQDEYNGEKRVQIVSKYNVSWGSYNHLLAVVYLMGLVTRNPNIKYVHVISGQDYPVADAKRFAEFETCGKVYMTCKRVMETNDGILRRYGIKHYFAPLLDIRSSCYYRLDHHFACQRRRIGRFEVQDLYKGMIWVSMPIDVCIYIYIYIHSYYGRCFYKGLRFSEIPEEVFFQTIIMHSKYKDCVVCDNLRYTLWQEKNGSSPGILDESDYEAILDSTAVFARKIDTDYSLKLIGLLDEEAGNV